MPLAPSSSGQIFRNRGGQIFRNHHLGANGASFAPRDHAIDLAAWAFWNGSGGITLTELLDRLDVVSAEALCFLVMASKYDADAVDDWLVVHGRPVVAA